MRTESLTFLLSTLFTLSCNGAFWRDFLNLRPISSIQDLFLTLCVGVLLTGLHWLLLLLVTFKHTRKPLFAVLVPLTVLAAYFMLAYQVYFSKEMIRNILQTDWLEAKELLSWSLLPLLLLSGCWLWVVFKLPHPRSNWKQSILWRASAIGIALLMMVLSLFPVLSQMLPLLRQHKELRYLVNPASLIVSTARVVKKDYIADSARQPLAILDPEPVQSPRAAKRKPVAIVLVVGETVRAQNWGLNGYERQTTPRLAAKPMVNFSDFRSAGTDTATSLPAMFSLYGRANYDREKITHTESILPLLNRAGVATLWRDNQSGDKGVNTGLPFEDLSSVQHNTLSNGPRNYDEILTENLNQLIDAQEGDILIVLHMLGNHGPAYFERYPEAFRKWTPVCNTSDLASASPASVVNAYDNAILYTDYVLDKAINMLSACKSHDTALLYVSDHGESLGETGIFLHGLPYWLAPDTQTRVPLCMWFSPGYALGQQLDLDCLQSKSSEPASHDNLFHTVLGMLDVESSVYDPALDLLRACRHP